MNVSMKITIKAGIIVLAAGMLGLSGCSKAPAQVVAPGGAQKAPEVEVVSVALTPLNWDQTYPGRLEGMRVSQVRPRVSGLIVKRSYVEGTFVKQGDTLFKIDPVPFELAVEKASAELARAKAQEDQADRDLKRVSKLFEGNAVSEKQHDDAVSAFDLAKAGRMSADVALRQAELNLAYTNVTSPISGVTSMEVFTEGSLVSSADILTTVTQIDPVFVMFSLPEGDPAYQQLFSKDSVHKEGSASLALFTRRGSEYGLAGKVNFSETGIDPLTGSVRMRAEFANPDGVLLPGQFARVAFKDMKLAPCAVIPEGAVLMTARGPVVYTVGQDGTVTVTPITLGPVLDSGQLVTEGLKDGDRVIFTSLIRLRPGMAVIAKVKGKDAAGGASSGK